MVFEYCDQDLKKYFDTCRGHVDKKTVQVFCIPKNFNWDSTNFNFLFLCCRIVFLRYALQDISFEHMINKFHASIFSEQVGFMRSLSFYK